MKSSTNPDRSPARTRLPKLPNPHKPARTDEAAETSGDESSCRIRHRRLRVERHLEEIVEISETIQVRSLNGTRSGRL